MGALFRLLLLVFRGIHGIFAFFWTTLAQGVRRLQGAANERRIEAGNEAHRGLNRRRNAYSVSALVRELPESGNLLISGDDSPGAEEDSWRNVITARLAELADEKHECVILLHRSNEALAARLAHELPEGRLVYLDAEHPRYDPLRGYAVEDCAMLLTGESLASVSGLGEASRRYMTGILKLFEWGYRRRPYIRGLIEVLDRVSRDEGFLQRTMERATDEGKLDGEQCLSIENDLTVGLSGRHALHEYLRKLYRQLRSLAVRESISESQMCSLRTIADSRQVAVVDLGNSTDPALTLGLMCNEIRGLCAEGRRIRLVLDDMALEGCEAMKLLLAEPPASLRWCVSDMDFATAGKDKIQPLLGNRCSLVLLRHDNGVSARTWQEVLGTFRKHEITRSWQSGQMKHSPFRFTSGSQSGSGITVAEKDDYRVNIDELMQLPMGWVLIQNRRQDRLVRTQLSEQ